MVSDKARKQIRQLYNAPMHLKRKWMAAHLEENLLLKYDRRSMPVVKGDTVKVMRGSYKGHEDKVAHVNISKRYVEVEGLTLIKADGKKIAKPIHPSNLLITKMNLTDKWRRRKIERGLSEEAKKEIEKEAEEQLKELEAEKKKAEEEKKKEEMLEEAEEEIEETLVEKPELPKKTEEKKKPVKKAAPKKKKETKPSAEEKKKPVKKKATAKAKPKTPAKKPAAKKKTEAKK